MKDPIFEEAVKAYNRFCKENGFVYDQPSEVMSTVRRKYVYLENGSGTLAKYDIKSKLIVKP